MYHVLCWFIILFRLLSVMVTFYSKFQIYIYIYIYIYVCVCVCVCVWKELPVRYYTVYDYCTTTTTTGYKKVVMTDLYDLSFQKS
jgi:hypothetical protein